MDAPSSHTASRSLKLVSACGLISAIAFAVLAWQSHGHLSIWTFLSISAIAWGVLYVAWQSSAHVPPVQLHLLLWGVALLLRAIGFFGAPIFEDDWYRYLWDGRQFAVSGIPYDVAPRASFSDSQVPESFQSILNQINYPDVPTIYGPVCQYLFAASYWIAPAELWPLKLMLIGADVFIMWLLLRLTSVRNTLLYAWCPLVIQETAFTAHIEILGVALLVAAFWARRKRFVVLTGILCAFAVAARIHAVIIIPFLLWPLRVRQLGAFALVVAALYLPFWLQGSAADWSGLKAFLGEWEFNSSLFGMVKWLANWQFAKVICGALFALGALFIFARWAKRSDANTLDSPTTQMQWVLMLFFLCSAVVNPWYLLWLAPFAAIRPTLTVFAAMAFLSLSYIHGATVETLGLSPYEHPKWLRPLEYGLILATALFERRRNLSAANWKTR